MLLKSNIHTHTTFSDGRNTPVEMVEAALRKGFFALGFSDHGYAPYDNASMAWSAEPRYRAKVRELAERYAGRIEIPLGYEHDYHMPETDLSWYDYIIESVHFFHKQGQYFPIDESAESLRQTIYQLFFGDAYVMAADYFNTVCQSIMDTRGQIIGHIGLITKYNEIDPILDPDDRRYLNPAREALRCAAERDLLVEVNTGAMARGYRSQPYPDRILLKHFNQLHGRVILSSDSHSADTIDFAFDAALQILRDAGFKEVWQWKNGGFEPEAID